MIANIFDIILINFIIIEYSMDLNFKDYHSNIFHTVYTYVLSHNSF